MSQKASKSSVNILADAVLEALAGTARILSLSVAEAVFMELTLSILGVCERSLMLLESSTARCFYKSVKCLMTVGALTKWQPIKPRKRQYRASTASSTHLAKTTARGIRISLFCLTADGQRDP